jgi:hypothetical protein
MFFQTKTSILYKPVSVDVQDCAGENDCLGEREPVSHDSETICIFYLSKVHKRLLNVLAVCNISSNHDLISNYEYEQQNYQSRQTVAENRIKNSVKNFINITTINQYLIHLK